MSSLLYKWIFHKTVGEVNVGSEEDPFHETIPHEELGRFQREGAKRKKPLPPGLSKNDEKVLKSVRSRAYQLDLVFQCCCGCRLGWAGIIGLIPWIGDVIAFYLAMLLIRKARTIDGGLPKYLEAQMMANITFDFCIGLIPIVGDLINMAYKANTRNYILLETHLRKHCSNNKTNEPKQSLKTSAKTTQEASNVTPKAPPRTQSQGPQVPPRVL